VGIGFGYGFEMAAIARNLAAEGTFGNPFEPAVTGPTAVVPPLYPAFLAALIGIFAKPEVIVIVAAVVNIVADALTAALMPALSMVIFRNPLPGFFAGLLWVSSMRLQPQWDVSFTVTGLLLFCILTARTIARDGGGWRYAAAAGLLGGVLVLLNPATVLVFTPWVVFLVLFRRATHREAISYMFLLVLGVAVCNAPWAVRNYRLWRGFVLRTNLGMTLYASNNDCAQSSLARNREVGCYQATHPVESKVELALMQADGEVQYDRRKTADALHWIRSHPDRFRQLTLARVAEFWFPDPKRPDYIAYSIWVSTILSIPGVVLLARRRVPFVLFTMFVWLVYPLLYYIVVSDARYRYPILWTSLLPAGYWLASLKMRCTRARHKVQLS
jgi:hypothetical protein